MHRRRFCRLLGASALLAGGGCLGGTSEQGNQSPADNTNQATSGWPTFGRNHQHTGVHEEGTGPRTGTVAWTGIGDAPTVLCSPSVADGTVYVGSAADAIHAFDTATGELQWRYDTTDYVETAPAVVGDTVYTADSEGVVYAVSTDGAERWTHETNHNFHSRAVAVHGDTLVVGTAGTMPAVVSGDTDETKAGIVRGLDLATGEEQWSFSGPQDWFTGPAVGGDRVFVGNHDGTLLALDPATGDETWRWTPSGGEGGFLAPPTYFDGTVYVGVHGLGQVMALDAERGEERWSQDLKAPNVKSSPAVDGDRVYVGASGSESSDYDAPDEPTQTPTPTPEDDAVQMPSIEISGSVFALSAADGTIEWRYETGHDFRSSPAVVGDRVYIGGGDRLLTLARSDGTKQWHVSFGDFVDSSPAVVDGRAYIGSADGHLYCIGPP